MDELIVTQTVVKKTYI